MTFFSIGRSLQPTSRGFFHTVFSCRSSSNGGTKKEKDLKVKDILHSGNERTFNSLFSYIGVRVGVAQRRAL